MNEPRWHAIRVDSACASEILAELAGIYAGTEVALLGLGGLAGLLGGGTLLLLVLVGMMAPLGLAVAYVSDYLQSPRRAATTATSLRLERRTGIVDVPFEGLSGLTFTGRHLGYLFVRLRTGERIGMGPGFGGRTAFVAELRAALEGWARANQIPIRSRPVRSILRRATEIQLGEPAA